MSWYTSAAGCQRGPAPSRSLPSTQLNIIQSVKNEQNLSNFPLSIKSLLLHLSAQMNALQVQHSQYLTHFKSMRSSHDGRLPQVAMQDCILYLQTFLIEHKRFQLLNPYHHLNKAIVIFFKDSKSKMILKGRNVILFITCSSRSPSPKESLHRSVVCLSEMSKFKKSNRKSNEMMTESEFGLNFALISSIQDRNRLQSNKFDVIIQVQYWKGLCYFVRCVFDLFFSPPQLLTNSPHQLMVNNKLFSFFSNPRISLFPHPRLCICRLPHHESSTHCISYQQPNFPHFPYSPLALLCINQNYILQKKRKCFFWRSRTFSLRQICSQFNSGSYWRRYLNGGRLKSLVGAIAVIFREA